VFGFSIPKLLLLIVLLLVVWYGFKLIEHRTSRRDEIEKAAEAAVRRNVEQRQSKERASSVETAECATCGSFVPRESPTACERSDCPHPAA